MWVNYLIATVMVYLGIGLGIRLVWNGVARKEVVAKDFVYKWGVIVANVAWSYYQEWKAKH